MTGSIPAAGKSRVINESAVCFRYDMTTGIRKGRKETDGARKNRKRCVEKVERLKDGKKGEVKLLRKG